MIKNKCKKTVSAMLLMTMIATTFSVDVFAAPKHSEGGLLSDNSTYTDEAKSIKEVTIGNEIESKKIEDIVVIPKKQIKSVSIKDGVTRISNYAFQGCESLTSVTIPNSVTSIGEGAFQECTSLTSVTIPDSVTQIGNYAFQGCKNLTLVTIYNGTTKISKNAFKQCIKLKSIFIPDSVQSNDEATKVVKDNVQSIDEIDDVQSPLVISDSVLQCRKSMLSNDEIRDFQEVLRGVRELMSSELECKSLDACASPQHLELCYACASPRRVMASKRKCNCFACCFGCCEKKEYSGYKGNTFGGIKVTRDL